MKCFVIAMDKEAAPVIAAMTDTSEKKISGKRVIYGALCGETVAVVVCGVGKVNAACGAQIAVTGLNADAVINIGVAGGLNDGLKIGELYGISAAVQYDFDLTQLNGTEIGTLDELTENYIPLSYGGRYPAKRLATGDRFNDSKDDYKLLTGVLDADIRDMEGGAIAQTCLHAQVKCRAYKVISDLAGSGSTTEQYLKNLDVCFKKITEEIQNIAKEV